MNDSGLCTLCCTPKKLSFVEGDESIIIHHNFISPQICKEICNICETFDHWENDSTTTYAQATYDLEVEKCPALSTFLRNIGLISVIDRFYQLHYHQYINSFDDVFVIKYQAEGTDVKSELQEHIDAGDLSFMIALSDKDTDYSGGGTFFRATNNVIHITQGSMLTFDAKLYHKGVKITSGVRYLLVGFCHTDSVVVDSNTVIVLRGNLAKDLTVIG